MLQLLSPCLGNKGVAMGEIKGLEMDEKKLSSPKPPCHGGLCIEIPDYSMKQDFGPMLNMQQVTRLRGVGVKNLLPVIVFCGSEPQTYICVVLYLF